MKNIKVRTKLTIILALVIVLVTSESFISIKNMNQLKNKALETMDTSSRQNYDDSIKEQVGVVISLLSEINNEYKSGKYTLDEAKKIAADEIRQMRYGEAGYFWVDQSDGKNIVLLGSSTEGTNRMNTKDADGFFLFYLILPTNGIVFVDETMFLLYNRGRNYVQRRYLSCLTVPDAIWSLWKG